MEAEDLLTENTNEEDSHDSCTYKGMQNLSKDDTIFNDVKLQRRASDQEKHHMKHTLEHEEDNSSWENPLDSLVNSYEKKKIDNIKSVFEDETDNLHGPGELTSQKESSLPILEKGPTKLMGESAAYRFFQDLQRDEQGVLIKLIQRYIPQSLTVNLSSLCFSYTDR
jgi:hypothetical protein